MVIQCARRWFLGLALAAQCIAAALPALAQSRSNIREPRPEQPSWRASSASAQPEDSSYDTSSGTNRFDYRSSIEDNAASDTSAEAPGRPLRPLPAAVIDPDAASLSVPENQTLLPTLSIASPWFEMDGLRMKLGPAQIRFDLDMNFGYNDNIFGTNNPRTADYITTISPTIEVGIGRYPRPRPLVTLDEKANYFSLKYTPSFQFFAVNEDQNTVNESLNVGGRYTFRRLSLEGGFSYARTENPTPANVGRQEYSTYTLAMKASYALTAKTFFQLGVIGNLQEYTEIADSRTETVSVAPALAWQVSKKLELTLGPTAGVTYVENGGEQPFQSFNLGFTYDSLRKLEFHGMLGVQATQFTGNNPTGAEDFIEPVFSLGTAYKIDETSNVGLDLSRSVTTAGTTNGQTYVSTQLAVSYNKIFLSRVSLDVTGTFQSLDYQGGDDRTDTYVSFSTKLGYLFWQQRCNAYLIYTRTQRFSEISAYEYDANFIGTGLGVQF